jgi:hypothetical protein
MTTYHVELKGYCDVIVEANSEEEAFDRAVARIPASSLSIETAEVKGVLEGEALEQAYRYFPEHLAMVDTEKFYNEDELLAPDPTRLLKDDESIDYLEACFENGDILSSRQYQILYQASLQKLECLAKRNDLSFPEQPLVTELTPKELLRGVYDMYKKSIGREEYTMDCGLNWVDSSGMIKYGTYEATREEIIVHTVFQKLIGD